MRSGSASGYSHVPSKLAPQFSSDKSHASITPRQHLVPKIGNYMQRGSKNVVPSKSPRQHSNNHLRQKRSSQSPNRDIDMRDAGHGLMTGGIMSPVRTATTSYIAQLRIDNESLQSRLNMVLTELDRINRDRSGLV